MQTELVASLAGSPVRASSEQQNLCRIIDIACRGCQSTISSREFQQIAKSINALRAKYSQSV